MADTSRGSTLPVWITHELGHGQVGVECPYKDCGCKAKVHKRKWLQGQGPNREEEDQETGVVKRRDTRGCAYCGRWAWLPGSEPS